MCNIRKSYYGKQVKFYVMHLFWWNITFFGLDCFDVLKDFISSSLCEG
jgi:hypothetical protein